MTRRAVLLFSVAGVASGALGCQRVLDVIHNLTGGAPSSNPPPATGGGGGGPGGHAPAAPPAAAPPTVGSVRTPAVSRATGCPALMANAALPAGTLHNNIEHDETWTLEDSPHRVPDGLVVGDGATLTLAPCAVVLVGHGQGVWVHDGAGIVAVGDAEHPVRFGSNDPQPQAGDWQAVWIDANARRSSRLSYTVFENGGSEWNGRSACLSVVVPGLHVDHVTARQCRGFGLALVESGAFTADSSNVVVTATVAGNAPFTGAVYVQRAPSVASVPTGAYTGNTTDEVFIAEGAPGSDTNTIRQSSVWKNLGVPYHVADDVDIRVDGPTAPVLTIASGVTIRFGRSAGLSVGYDAEGGLMMDGGSEATRIVLRPGGTDESPRQWHGVYFGPRYNRTVSRLRYVTIRNAGQAWNGQLCDWDGAQRDDPFLMLEAQPGPTSIDHVTFAGGAPDNVAIGRKWNANPIDFNDPALGNDFSQFGAGCHQSPQPDGAGACPDPAPHCN